MDTGLGGIEGADTKVTVRVGMRVWVGIRVLIRARACGHVGI